ncbi:hypothetical protein U1Q18_021581 [Sarracenia purpurea var. burkii]
MDLNGIPFVEEDFFVEIITGADILTQEDEEEEVFSIMPVKSVVELTTLLWIAIIDWTLSIDNNHLLTSKVKEIKVKEISSHMHYLLLIQNLNQNKCLENSNSELHAPKTPPLWWSTSVPQPTTGDSPDSASGSTPLFSHSSNLPTSPTSTTTPLQSPYHAPASIHLTEHVSVHSPQLPEPAPLQLTESASQLTEPVHSPQPANTHPMVTRAKAGIHKPRSVRRHPQVPTDQVRRLKVMLLRNSISRRRPVLPHLVHRRRCLIRKLHRREDHPARMIGAHLRRSVSQISDSSALTPIENQERILKWYQWIQEAISEAISPELSIAGDKIRQGRRRTGDSITKEHFCSKIQRRSGVWGSRRAGSKSSEHLQQRRPMACVRHGKRRRARDQSEGAATDDTI